jgi:putative endonuclease
MDSYFVYILASKKNGTLYTGSTTDLIKRIWQHKNKVVPCFTEKYNISILVYYEVHQQYIEAARREKRFKNWCRQWKIDLIEKTNPNWNDLYHEICS